MRNIRIQGLMVVNSQGAKPSDLPVEQPTNFRICAQLKNRQGNRRIGTEVDLIAR
jgi:hypothetical protein